MAMVRVTPMTADKVLVAPSMLSPSVASLVDMKATRAPTLPNSRPRFMGCRPGSSSGAELSKPGRGE